MRQVYTLHTQNSREKRGWHLFPRSTEEARGKERACINWLRVREWDYGKWEVPHRPIIKGLVLQPFIKGIEDTLTIICVRWACYSLGCALQKILVAFAGPLRGLVSYRPCIKLSRYVKISG